VTYIAASIPLLSDIRDAVKAGAPRPPSLRFIPQRRRAYSVSADRAGGKRARHQGMLAVGNDRDLVGTLTEPSRASDKSPTADGRALEGSAHRLFLTESRFRPDNPGGSWCEAVRCSPAIARSPN
jgi:cyclohexanecarboxylate-CoA ligase